MRGLVAPDPGHTDETQLHAPTSVERDQATGTNQLSPGVGDKHFVFADPTVERRCRTFHTAPDRAGRNWLVLEDLLGLAAALGDMWPATRGGSHPG
jgi:hypothetical protein